MGLQEEGTYLLNLVKEIIPILQAIHQNVATLQKLYNAMLDTLDNAYKLRQNTIDLLDGDLRKTYETLAKKLNRYERLMVQFEISAKQVSKTEVERRKTALMNAAMVRRNYSLFVFHSNDLGLTIRSLREAVRDI